MNQQFAKKPQSGVPQNYGQLVNGQEVLNVQIPGRASDVVNAKTNQLEYTRNNMSS
jgi:hypothetical protein